jgi:hypothetical protein
MIYIIPLPKYSLKGVKVIGPRATPRTYKPNPNVPTTPETPNILSISFRTDD